MISTFEVRLTERYGELSDALRVAADYIVDNPIDLATRSLRSVSRDSGISPAAFSRLARALDYSDIEELREEVRTKIGQRVNNFAARAERLHNDPQNRNAGFLDAHLTACQRNLQHFGETIDRKALDEAVERISRARKVLLLGALGSTGVVEYLSYMASFCAENWSLASRMGASLGAGIAGLGAEDVLIIVTKPPFSAQAIRAAALAQEQDVYVVLITDSLGCPALKHASARFIVPTDGPHFYSSYVVTMFLVETLIGVLISRSGPEARARIAEVEDANRVLAEVWDL
ncbi:MurR/RpiR family transcriptional regulator [Tritonibacter horizontis]|uniref:DNA-binding transcriptional regulator HexR n=1 Tax=Tritonibacter horizontis TaxID=1768241 RepID=A0A132BYA9_9RHOB|nr:MurR/RpiR family transcriptional regulator [Tritonibacter horizontis]KUP93383.1 DNA-binding transcriptional regulator HexR [Tritonibacter horizontis]